MNTKTMRLPPRRVLTSNKRKDFEGFDTLNPSPPSHPASSSSLTKLAKPVVAPPPQAKKLLQSEPVPSSNKLLAGYLAHEYLTKGTLFGQQPDPSRPGKTVEPNNSKKIKLSEKGREAEPLSKDNYQRFVEVCHLLKGEEGAHLPGVFNPSQLARFLQM